MRKRCPKYFFTCRFTSQRLWCCCHPKLTFFLIYNFVEKTQILERRMRIVKAFAAKKSFSCENKGCSASGFQITCLYKWRLHYSPHGKGAQLIKPWNTSQLTPRHSIPELLLISQHCNAHGLPAPVGFHRSQLVLTVSSPEQQFPIDRAETLAAPRRENARCKGLSSLKISPRNKQGNLKLTKRRRWH